MAAGGVGELAAGRGMRTGGSGERGEGGERAAQAGAGRGVPSGGARGG